MNYLTISEFLLTWWTLVFVLMIYTWVFWCFKLYLLKSLK